MASHTIFGQRWPDGTVVSVYPAASWVNQSMQPSGSAVSSAVAAGGSVTLSGLATSTRYVAWAAGLGVTFLVPGISPTDSDRSRVSALEGEFSSVSNNITMEQATRLANDQAAISLGRVLQAFAPPRSGIYALLKGTTYQFIMGVGNGRYAIIELPLESTNPGSYPLHQMNAISIALPMVSVIAASGTLTGTWLDSVNAAAYNGVAKQSSTPGDTASVSSPAGATSVGIRIVQATNGGLMKVSIDGDSTRATKCSTAQQVVDSGAYPNTILVTNGGTLQPTDRVVDCWWPNATTQWDTKVALADDLTPGVHVTTLTVTGYQHVGGAGGRTYVSGFASTTALAITNTTVALFVTDWINNSVGSAYEYAIQTVPIGASTPTFLGNIHGYEVEDSFTVEIDGVGTTLVDGVITPGVNTINFVRGSHLLHPETGATVIANVSTIYRLARHGLEVEPTITWLVPTTIYAAFSMCPANHALNESGKFDRAALLASPLVMAFTGLSDTYYGNSKSSAGWLWGTATKAAILTWMPDVEGFTEGWAHTSVFARVEDRGNSFPKVSKVYFPWGDTSTGPFSVAGGAVKTWKTSYLPAYFPGGADAALAESSWRPDSIAANINSLDRGNGQTGMLAPSSPNVGSATVTVVANQAFVARFVPSKDRTIVKVAFAVSTPASVNDAVDVAIYDAALQLIVSKGATTGLLNVGGVSVVTLPSAVSLVSGRVYYAALSVGTIGGTAAVLVASAFGGGAGTQLFGAVIPQLEAGIKAASHPLPASIASPAAAPSGLVPTLALRES
jgi:hypothetical protein